MNYKPINIKSGAITDNINFDNFINFNINNLNLNDKDNVIQLNLYKLTLDKISFKELQNYQINNILRNIYYNCLWNKNISFPKFENLEDLLIVMEYLQNKFNSKDNTIYKNNYYYLDSTNTNDKYTGIENNCNNNNVNTSNERSNNNDAITTSNIGNNLDRKNLKKKHIEKPVDIPSVNYYLISRKKRTYNYFINSIIELIIQENKTKQFLKNEETFQKLSNILLDIQIYKSFCELIYKNHQNNLCRLIKIFKKIIINLFTTNPEYFTIFINIIINPLVEKYEYCKFLYHDYLFKREEINYRDYKEELRKLKHIYEWMEKKLTVIYDIFTRPENKNTQKICDYINAIFINKYIIIETDEIEDIDNTEMSEGNKNEEIIKNKNKKRNYILSKKLKKIRNENKFKDDNIEENSFEDEVIYNTDFNEKYKNKKKTKNSNENNSNEKTEENSKEEDKNKDENKNKNENKNKDENKIENNNKNKNENKNKDIINNNKKSDKNNNTKVNKVIPKNKSIKNNKEKNTLKKPIISSNLNKNTIKKDNNNQNNSNDLYRGNEIDSDEEVYNANNVQNNKNKKNIDKNDKETKTKKENKNIKDNKENKENEGNKESKDNKDNKEIKESKNFIIKISSNIQKDIKVEK